MKLETFSKASLRSKQKIIREPLYTLSEIAEKLGMQHKVIAGYMRGNKGGGRPKPARVNHTLSIRTGHKLYKLSEFKLWVKELGKSNELL
jgi:hypothetical protein